jgi:hypothetical protein
MPAELDHNRLALVLDAWKHSVSVQMHFNEIGMKIRNLYFTILAADFGLIGASQGRSFNIEWWNVSIELATFAIFVAVPISALFYFMDRHWYHRLLLGAVDHCGAIEKQYGDLLPEIRLGRSISDKSPVQLSMWWRRVFPFVSEKRFRKEAKLHSDGKIEIIYKSVMWAAAILTLAYGAIDGVKYGGRPVLSLLVECIQSEKSAPQQVPQTPQLPLTQDEGQSDATDSQPGAAAPADPQSSSK